VLISGNAVLVLLNQGGDFLEPAGRFLVGREPHSVLAMDQDGAGALDLVAVSEASLAVLLTRAGALSRDEDADGVPDECGTAGFRRGDVDADGSLDLGDVMAALFYLFRGGREPSCRKAADMNYYDGALGVADAGVPALIEALGDRNREILALWVLSYRGKTEDSAVPSIAIKTHMTRLESVREASSSAAAPSLVSLESRFDALARQLRQVEQKLDALLNSHDPVRREIFHRAGIGGP
jgi:hypothetical protein